MDWIHNYQLFLFDFDGLLVNTEKIHYEAYRAMCSARGFQLDWSFTKYCEIAHYSSEGLQRVVYTKFPELQKKEPNWDVLYKEKTAAYIRLIEEGKVELMPGAKAFLETIKDAGVKRCLVTHSQRKLVECITRQHPVIATIPNWITREDYQVAKPSSECYETAIRKFAAKEDQVVGFEDTPRGMKALMPTGAQAVIVTETNYPEIPHFVSQGALHFPTLIDVAQYSTLTKKSP